MSYVIATAETRNFTFQTLTHTREDADRQLLKAWRAHRREYGAGVDPSLMREMIADGEVNYVELEVGQSTRDGEVLK